MQKKRNNEIEFLVNTIKLFDKIIIGKKGDRKYYISLGDIYYFEFFERKAFAYTDKNVYEINYKSYQLEDILHGKLSLLILR